MTQHATNKPAVTASISLGAEGYAADQWPALSGGFLDGAHSPQNVAFYSFCLGALFMAFVGCIVYSVLPLQLSVYLTTLMLFHFLEYFATALWNTPKVNLDSFLIDHSTAYHVANGAGILEFVVEWLLTPEWKQLGWWTLLGFLLVCMGQWARTQAMATAGRSFNHQVQARRLHDHQLVTHGIYSWMRHPSYFGFYFWALGTQLMLANPFSFVAFLFVLHRFFADRIAYEERALLRFFGQDYYAYKQRVGTMMPFIYGC
ncbi:Isoprenylcysteine carboxyl methyltransferase family-domain-containing protein [Syncephalis pseudoplumigaleata]|uniref:Protein-S-isoprenylcysteine O-methyltransferase n=1 Tax=Syncephalis pseudoplumigaleata TaxID=1712513 RepID=A0A4P9Z640_9FUNG|nr:Isoprenylcysteine carboxyl methyltransferase family-domain-containing protein [Syncephalis pseudoplumigaleata]|eukprot:RKP27582.1 Isoprenylcysteine carboxyl methyltransferase family-domain-containing protein [Syncephalis pseudoplumigaleata]